MPLPQEEDIDELAHDVAYFAQNHRTRLDAWHQILGEIQYSGRRAVLWGGGSKGVTFLTTLNIHDEVGYVVDINPYKQGMYMAGAGHEIVAPAFLQEYRPDVVIVMNPIYREEIQKELNRMGINPELMTVQS